MRRVFWDHSLCLQWKQAAWEQRDQFLPIAIFGGGRPGATRSGGPPAQLCVLSVFSVFFVFSFQSDQLVTKSARETNLLLLARRGAFRFPALPSLLASCPLESCSDGCILSVNRVCLAQCTLRIAFLIYRLTLHEKSPFTAPLTQPELRCGGRVKWSVQAHGT